MSQRGDSGRLGVVAMTIMDHSADKARGKRHVTVPLACEIPNVIQAWMDRPMLTKRPSSRTTEPLCSALEHSLCQLGAVAVRPPNPRPETRRPTISWSREKEDDWMMAPRALMAAPSMMVRIRPSQSPM